MGRDPRCQQGTLRHIAAITDRPVIRRRLVVVPSDGCLSPGTCPARRDDEPWPLGGYPREAARGHRTRGGSVTAHRSMASTRPRA